MTEGLSCSAPADEQKFRIPENLYNSPELLANYFEIRVNTELTGSGDEQQQGSVGRVTGFWDALNEGKISHIIKAAGSTPSVAPSTTSCSPTQTSSTLSIRRKRLVRDEDDDSCDDDKHERFYKRRKNNSPHPADQELAKFACPFRKHNPRKYGIHESRICALSHWSSVSRVKFVIYGCTGD
jgi:hypothetical protein